MVKAVEDALPERASLDLPLPCCVASESEAKVERPSGPGPIDEREEEDEACSACSRSFLRSCGV